MNFFNKFNKLTKRKIDYKKILIVFGIVVLCATLIVLNQNKSKAIFKFSGTGTTINSVVSGEQYKTFYITYNGTIYEYNFDDGMTWNDFISSSYNDGNFSISGSNIKYINKIIVVESDSVTTSDLITEGSFDTGVMISTLSIGDTIDVSYNGSNIKGYIIHQGNPLTSKYTSACTGTWIALPNAKIYTKISSNSVSYFPNATIYSEMDNTYLPKIGSEIRNSIKKASIPTHDGKWNTHLFFLSTTEIGLDSSTEITEGAILSFFEEGEGTSAVSTRKKIYSGTSNYWTRTRASSNRWEYIKQGIYQGNQAGEQYTNYIVPCFILPSDFVVK